MGDEDFFSDAAFDDLPDDTLQQLEQNAISSTQRARAAGPASRFAPNNRFGSSVSAAAPVKSKLPWRPPQPQSRPQSIQPPQYVPQAPPASAPAPPSSDYGLDDEEDIINLDEPSMVIQPASGPHMHNFSKNNHAPRVPSAAARYTPKPKPLLDDETSAAFAAADAELGAHKNQNQWTHAPHLQPQPQNGGSSMDLSALQSRIANLESESHLLRESEAAARAAAAVKAGENAIVRSKAEAQAKEYERRIAVMQKLAADDAARNKAEVERERKEREKMATDNRFLQHDLEQESERVKRLNGPGKTRTGSGTPKKVNRRTMGLGDGFEDLEVRAVSPSRSREKGRDGFGTPVKHGAKRRRTANDSPVAALSFTQLPPPAGGVVRQGSGEGSVASSASEMKVKAMEIDRRYAFMQRLLNHIPYEGHERSMEALSKYHLPSTPTRSLSADLLDLLSYPPVTGTEQETGTDYLPLKLSRALLQLWTHCLNAHFHAPLYLLLDLLRFALFTQSPETIVQLIEEAVPLCIRTVDLIATPTARMSSNPTYAASIDRSAHDCMAEELCPDEVMNFLLVLCEASTLVEGRLEVFWREVGLEFALLMLHRCHPVTQINCMLRCLATSALEGSVGPISGDVGMQVSQENGILDRLTSLIFEIPEVPKGEGPYSEVRVAELRINLLGVLKALCRTDHGCALLAGNRSLVGRLIRFLDGQINRLYTLPPAFSQQVSRTKGGGDGKELAQTRSGGGDGSAHGLVVQTINTTTRLFYHILRIHSETIDLTAKLNVIHGGHQKFLVCMSRVAFSEQSVLEAGIEDEVVEAAHSILDSYLSPEEGEAIVAAVETPRGSKGSDLARGMVVDGEAVEGDTEMSDPG
ncbi:hypothetical protein LTR56_023688 [Elasticomyces elasticus]|nr:hypothetical protein LTR56_023688 [Elasticomyces elasticus]KAK3624945.1 hypothetical protein LTR22_023768 [Elasticomyces elasticus]KAK4908927.1 hypothetical protein LTR49_022231 [Elasticomyces elasticus]KAK5745822.1 hypothetical protein LTS12_022974 [Elasticomyces elasticus]